LAHRAFVGLPEGHIQTEAAHAFIDGIRDREVKQQLLLGGTCTLNDALNRAVNLEAAKAAAWPTARLREVTREPTRRPPTPPERRRNERPLCWQCENSGHFWRDCKQRRFRRFFIHNGSLLHSKSQYTTVKHSRKLLEHTYMSDLYGPGALIPIGFFQQDLLWQSSNTHCHSCSHKASKHTSGQSIAGLSVHLHTTTALRHIVHH
jgi:hypothetical protein